MGRIGITFEDVEKAITELQSCKKNATVDNVRAILGTGSKSTIARFLREWKTKRGLQSDDDGRLPSELLVMVNGLWDALRDKADAETAEYRRENDAKTAEIQQQLAQARKTEAGLRLNIHTLEEKSHRQTEEIQKLKAQLMTESQEKIRMTERTIALETLRHENHAENQRLHQLLKHVQENLEHYQTATQQLRQEQSLLMEKQRNEYEQKLAAMAAQVNTATSDKAGLQAELTQIKKSYDCIQNEHGEMSAQYAVIHSRYETLIIAHDKMQKIYDDLDKQNRSQADELAALQRHIMELQLTLRTKDEKIAFIEESLTTAKNKIETIRHEHQFALQEKAGLAGQLKQLQKMISAGKVLDEA